MDDLSAEELVDVDLLVGLLVLAAEVSGSEYLDAVAGEEIHYAEATYSPTINRSRCSRNSFLKYIMNLEKLGYFSKI